MRIVALSVAIVAIWVITACVGMGAENARSNEGLVGYWPFDETEGNQVYDILNVTNGTMNLGVSRTLGVYGGALQFSGGSGSVDCGQVATNTMLGNLTVTFWVKPDGNGTLVSIKGPNDSNLAFFLTRRLLPGGQGFVRYIHQYGIGSYQNRLLEGFPNGVWTHVAVVRNVAEKSVSIFCDASEKQVYRYEMQPTNEDTHLQMWIGGGRSSKEGFDGSMDEFGLFARALSPEEIGLIHAHGVEAFISRTPVSSGFASPEAYEISPVEQPRAYPWSAVVHLEVGTAEQQRSCSGVMISPRHVLTSATCLSDGGEPTAMTVTPSRQADFLPFGRASAVGVWDARSHSGNSLNDIAVLTLDAPIGFRCGWVECDKNAYDDQFFKENQFALPGYPDMPTSIRGEEMYLRQGPFDECTEDELSYDAPSHAGQSGSGILYDHGDGWTVQAVLSGSNTGAEVASTVCARLTPNILARIQEIINQDTPVQADYLPVNVQVAPDSLVRGERLDSMSFVICNNSTQVTVETLGVDLYLSDDDVISASDTHLKSHTFSRAFDPFDSHTINVTARPTIPATLAPGSYWLGVMLSTIDSDTSNNQTLGIDAYPLVVTAARSEAVQTYASSDIPQEVRDHQTSESILYVDTVARIPVCFKAFSFDLSIPIPEQLKGKRIFWKDRPCLVQANMYRILPKASPVLRICRRQRPKNAPASIRSVRVPTAGIRPVGRKSTHGPCTISAIWRETVRSISS